MEFCLSVIALLCQTVCNFKNVALGWSTFATLKNVTKQLFYKIACNASCCTEYTSKPVYNTHRTSQ